LITVTRHASLLEIGPTVQSTIDSNRLVSSLAVVAIKQVFINVGCSGCHIMNQTTGSAALIDTNVNATVSNITIKPFSDFAVHNMGSGLADRVSLYGARSFRDRRHTWSSLVKCVMSDPSTAQQGLEHAQCIYSLRINDRDCCCVLGASLPPETLQRLVKREANAEPIKWLLYHRSSAVLGVTFESDHFVEDLQHAHDEWCAAVQEGARRINNTWVVSVSPYHFLLIFERLRGALECLPRTFDSRFAHMDCVTVSF
jgi:hypothetical protein